MDDPQVPLMMDNPSADSDRSSDSDEEEEEPIIRPGLRWDHVNNMDLFFRRVYEFHQRGGFLCILAEEVFSLMQFVFVVCFSTFLIRCVDYKILFSTPAYGNITHLGDAFIPTRQCIANFPAAINLLLLMAVVVLIVYGVKVTNRIIRFRETSVFYSTALEIPSSDLGNLTWNEVMDRIVTASKKMNLCASKDHLDHFDICSRIMRFNNYMIAMINKELLPLNYRLPLVGEFVYFPKYYCQSLEFLFFNSPWSLFDSYWMLNSDVKLIGRRTELAALLRKRMLYFGLITLICSPVLFIWEMFLSFFKYTILLKREPGRFSARRWSLYAKFFLRDYNELDHIFERRLHASHKSASQYMDMFTSPIVIILCKNVLFFAGALLASLIALSMIDEDVIRIEGVFQAIAWLTLTVGVVAKLIPDENAVYDVALTFSYILANIHYCPEEWKGNEHKVEVRNAFSNLFHMKVTYCFEELLSPFISPIVILFRLRPRAQKIIDFFRNFTKYVDGVGDVCSLYDIKRHGDPRWKVSVNRDVDLQTMGTSDFGQHGKTEISLVNFSTNYPEWKPRRHDSRFIESFRARAAQDMRWQRPYAEGQTLMGVPEMGSLIGQMMPNMTLGTGIHLRGAVARMPPRNFDATMSLGLNSQSMMAGGDASPEQERHWPLPQPPPMPYQLRGPITDMGWGADETILNTLYMHELHDLRTQGLTSGTAAAARTQHE